MPRVNIPDKNMVINFPDTMAPEEIERAIYTHVYDQPVISEAPEPSAYQRLKEHVTPTEPTVGQPLTEEDIEAFEPAREIVPKRTPQADRLSTKLNQFFDFKAGFPQIKPEDAEIVREMVKDSLFGELPAGIGYLQKPVEEAADYWGKYTMSEEEEMEMARKHPNLMAARYAAASILLPGVSQYFASTVDLEEFKKKSIEEQRLEILGTTGAYVVFGAAFRWGTQGLARLAKSYPWMTKPIIRALKESTWFRRMTNKERGLTLQTVNQMKEAGLNDAQILKNLRNRNRTEYKAYFDEAVRTRGLGRAEEAGIARPAKPTVVVPPPKEAPPDFAKMQTDLDKGRITIDDLITQRDSIAKTYPELVDPINRMIIDKAASEVFVPEEEQPVIELTEEVEPSTIEKRVTAIEEAAKKEKEAIQKEFEEKKAKVAEEVKVTAKFIGWQETADGDHVALYNIESGPKKGTTVTVEGLKREGVAVPETPEKPEKVPSVKEKVEEVAKPIPKAKEPWEERLEEQYERVLKETGFLRTDPNVRKNIEYQHKRGVKQAIKEGKITSHPDYPELGKVEKKAKHISAPYVREGRVGNMLIKMKDGTLFESEKDTHVLMIDEFKDPKSINIDEIDNLGLRVKGPRIVWRGFPKGQFKIQLQNVRRGEIEAVLEKPTPPEAKVEEKPIPPAKPTVEKKPTKLTILKDKKGLLAEIDKAIEAAPKKPETKKVYEAIIRPLYDYKVVIRREILDSKAKAEKWVQDNTGEKETGSIVERDQPIETITFKIDGGATIFESKDALQAFRDKVKKTTQGQTIAIPKAKEPTIPKPVAAKQEKIGDLVPVKQKGWFTDGHILIKGEPPKGKIVPKEGKGADISVIAMEYKDTKPAELQYYYIHDPDVGTGVSKTPMPQLGADLYANKVLFKVGENYSNFVQAKFRVLANRFPDAEYRINPDSGMVVAYVKKKPVGVVMPIRAGEVASKDFPQLAGEPTMQKEAIEAGFLKEKEVKPPKKKTSLSTAKTLADVGGYAPKRYRYEVDCIHVQNAESIGKMVDQGKQVTYQTFIKNVSVNEIAEMFPYYEWGPGAKAGLRIKDDFAVSYYKSSYEGAPCYYMEHSAIEYVFTKTPTEAYSYADTGGYATLKHAVIEMPEMVELVHQLMQGKLPSIKKRLRALHGMARGLFRPTGIGAIELKADIFENSAEAAAILAHEIGHLVDWLPEKTMARGNILGRIASLKRYMKHTLPRAPQGELAALTEKDRQRIRREAAQLIKKEYADKWVDEEIRKELPITPEEVMGIWNWIDAAQRINKNLIDYVKGLNTPEKKSIIKEALKGQVSAQLKQFAKVIIEKTGKKIKLEPTPEELKALRRGKYEQLINQEIKKRKAFQVTEVMDELKALSREWKPFDPVADPTFTKYRYSSKELYADTFSALFNAPGLVKAKAPLFYEGFFNYLEKKPEVKKLYYEIQDDIKGGAIEKRRMDGIYDMFRSGDDAYALSLERDVKGSDLLKRAFIDANHFILKKVKLIGERNIPAGENPRYKLEEMIYSGSEAEWYLTNVLRNVIKPLEKQNFNWDDFGVELFLRRVAGERAEMANPKGWTPELARRKLAELKELRTERENQAIEDALKSFREVHEYVIEKGEAAQRWDPELIKVMKDTKEYATFDVIKYIIKRYGQAPAAKIYQQIGTFEEAANPATATILKDMAIIKATNRQIAAESVVNFLLKHFPKEIRVADTRWNGKFHEIKDRSPDSREGSIIYLKGGKAKGYYVNKYIAQTFEKNPIEGNIIARILGTTVQPFKKLYVELNYGFWIFNAFFRDYQRAVKMLPKNTWFKFLPHYLKGMRPAFRSVFGVPDSVIAEMQKGNMLISIADVHGLRPEDKQIEKLLRMYNITPSSWKHELIKPFGVFFNFYTNIGRALERTTKVGSYSYLKKKFPEMPSEVIGHIVRTRGGSPDFLRKGTWNPIYNNLLLYSNAMKEGYRGDYEAFSDTPGEFMWKQAKYTYMPKLLMFAGAIGMLGYATKAMFDGMSEYDKANYMDIPLGLTESGKSVYFRVPTDESSRFMGAILWKILNHKELGWGDVAVGLFDYMAGQAPTIHPGIDMLVDIVQYCSGRNPYDAFYGRYAIPEQIREAGGARSHKAFLRYLADKAGANIVYRFKGDSVDQIKGELEEIISYPVLSNLVGRFIKVSNYGVRQELRRAKEEARKDNTRALLDAKDVIIKVVNEEPLTDDDIKALILKPDIFERNMVLGLCRKHGMVYFDEFLRAGTTAEKAAVIKVLLEKEAFKLKSSEIDEVKEKPSPTKPTTLLEYGESPKKGLLAYGEE